MKKKTKTNQRTARLSVLALGLMSILFIAAACSFVSGGNTSVQQTIEAASLQLTMMAQQSTQTALDQLNLQIAAQNATLEAQAAQLTALAAQPVETQPVIIPQTQIVETPTTETSASIQLTDWYGDGWTFSKSSICNDKKVGCWQAVMKEGQVAILTSRESVTVDPAWENPHIVFWTRYKGMYSLTFGFAELDVETMPGYTRVMSFGGTRDYWHEVVINLNEFKDTTFKLRFYGEGQAKLWENDPAYKFTWLIENVQIVPNYIPK